MSETFNDESIKMILDLTSKEIKSLKEQLNESESRIRVLEEDIINANSREDRLHKNLDRLHKTLDSFFKTIMNHKELQVYFESDECDIDLRNGYKDFKAWYDLKEENK